MSQQPLDYRSALADVRRSDRVRTATILATCVILVANGLLLGIAAADRSWGALGIAIMIGPITNGVLLVLSLACVPMVKSAAAGASIGSYLVVGIGLPLAAIPIDFFLIGSMGLHGC
jgi:hypothetical protein